MDVMSGMPSSALNPDAPPFVPLAYRAVEDFSDQWWELVKSTAWYRDYWLRECFVDNAESHGDLHFVDGDASVLPEIGDIFDGYQRSEEEDAKENEKGLRDVIKWGAHKWRGLHGLAESPKFAQKVARVVKMRPSPRTIQQPR